MDQAVPSGHRRTEAPHRRSSDLANLRRMSVYVWDFRGRVLLALLSLLVAKLATVGVPLILKHLVDQLDRSRGLMVTVPLALLAGYGGLRLASAAFSELRDALFARVRYHAMRKLSLNFLAHLHQLSLRFHLDRRTGGVARDLERGAQSLSSVLNYLVFNIFPSIVELLFVAGLLLRQYPARYAGVTVLTVSVYVAFTLAVTRWRMHYRHTMNALESQAQGQAVDGLLNYETVKYFGNEAYELRRYEQTLGRWEEAAVMSSTTMSLLNFGQTAVIAVGVTVIMGFAAQGVASGAMTLGDLVLVNALMLQLFLPLNTLGIVYRALNYALADMDQAIRLLELEPEVQDRPGAPALAAGCGEVSFDHVRFAYRPERSVLEDVDFTIPAGARYAVVGPSGAGKSTLARLLFRFYDLNSGRILIDGQDIASCTQQSVREAVGIVPQDTVLFNESLYFNIAYAHPDATAEDVMQAARLADLHSFISSLPDGYDTMVGERGLKLSGGERQRVGIARAILKRPRILIFDEATSSLDSRSEQAILESLRNLSRNITTLAIAHRLSTIVDADRILVMERGRIAETGTHQDLLAAGGLYAELWRLQQQERGRVQPAWLPTADVPDGRAGRQPAPSLE